MCVAQTFGSESRSESQWQGLYQSCLCQQSPANMYLFGWKDLAAHIVTLPYLLELRHWYQVFVYEQQMTTCYLKRKVSLTEGY